MKLINKKFLSSVRINYMMQLLSIVLGFISVTLVVKFGGLETYGKVTGMFALGATVGNVVSFRTNEALVRFFKRGVAKKNHEIQYFAVVAGMFLDFVTGLALFTIIQVFTEAIGVYFLKSTTEQNAIMLFSCMASSNFLRGTGYGLLTAQECFNSISILGAFEQVIKTACIAWGVWNFENLQLYTIILLMFLSTIPFTLFYLFIALKILFKKPPRRWMRRKWTGFYWNFSINTFISATLKSGHKNLDSVILGYLSSPTTVGIYNLLRQFTSPIEMLAAPYASQIYPKFVDASCRKSVEPVRLAIRHGSRMLLMRSGIIIIPILIASYLYFLWNGIKMAGSDYLSFLILLTASAILQTLWWSRAFSLATRPQSSINANAIAMAITIFVMPLLIMNIGDLLGVAATALVRAVALHYFWNNELRLTHENLSANT